jgi:hypothetical protein
VFEGIAGEGHEERFVPVETDEFEPADLPARSPRRLNFFAEGSGVNVNDSLADASGYNVRKPCF